MDKKFVTKSAKETQKLGENFALRLGSGQANRKTAVVFGLSGNLGGGKTTFLQGFAKGLGIKEKILSPTYAIMKRFQIPKKNKNINSVKNTLSRNFYTFYHVDCYRLKGPKDILELDFENIIKNPKNIVAIEWPEKIKKVLPKSTILIKFKFIDNNKREIEILGP